MGNITQMDHALGMVMDALDELALRENTLLFFTSDNGPAPSFGGSGGSLRGNKRNEHEGGICVPALSGKPIERSSPEEAGFSVTKETCEKALQVMRGVKESIR